MNSPSQFRRRRLALFALGLVGAGGIAWSAANTGASSPNSPVSVKIDEKPVNSANSPLGASYAPIVKRVAPSVVKVHVTERAKNSPTGEMSPFFDNPELREFFGPFGFGNNNGRQGQARRIQPMPAPTQEGIGSGVVVSPDGYVLTNSHVVRGADSIQVSFNDGRELKAKVIGTDPQTDLAVIKVDAKDLPAITFADSEKVEVGDRVLAVGNPFGIGQTVTGGMVSGLGRATLGLDYEDFIQTDAAINPGNSGGALVDAEGRLIGINTAILSRSGGFQGVGLAIPSNLAHGVMEQLVSNGKVVRGFIGVSVQDVTPALADQFKLETHSGALIAEVTPNSPADKAGLQGGDVITKLDGKAVTDSRHLKLAIASVKPGSKLPAEVLRNGKTVNVDINVGTRNERALARARSGGLGNDDEDDTGAVASSEDTGTLNGVGVADLDSQARREFDVPAAVRGALVTSVEPNSAAANAGLQPGDVIQEINRHAVKSANDAIKLTEKSDTKKTLVRIWNQRGSRFVVVDESASPAGNS